MHTLLLGLVLALGMGVDQKTTSPAPTVTIQPTTFHDVYFGELLKANTLFDKYMKTTCTDPDYEAVDAAMHTEYNNFKSLSMRIEKEETDPMEQDHEFEVFVGFQFLLHESVEMHRTCENKHKSDVNPVI